MNGNLTFQFCVQRKGKKHVHFVMMKTTGLEYRPLAFHAKMEKYDFLEFLKIQFFMQHFFEFWSNCMDYLLINFYG